jgi:predicted Rossmann fold flavoprotein
LGINEVGEVGAVNQHSFDVLILGAGAAGLMAAIEAARRGRRVAVLERAERPGKKILISGGGRANFTNLHTRPDNFLSANPHFAKSALAGYTPADFIRLVERHGIAYHEKTLGQLFCDGSAQQIVDLLMSECAVAGVRVLLSIAAREVRRNDSSGAFTVDAGNDAYTAPALIVATGGLSIPKIGATGFGYEIARQFGVAIETCRPALVPLTLSGAEHAHFADLTGVSAPVIASCGKRSFRERMLFTHRGLSGPAILQISSYWKLPEAIRIDWSPERRLLAPLRAAHARRDLVAAKAALRAHLPARLADRLLEAASPQSWTNHALDELEHRLHAWTIAPSGTEGYEKAEVTAGGVSTSALSAQTMECRSVRGLYFIGEVVDVTGQLGGFNFQWAWASGAAAGRAV